MTTEAAVPEILLIDDEAPIRRLLRSTLEEAGYRVRSAGTGAEGWHEFMQAQPDAIILDMGLPDQTGLEVLARLREKSDLPVLILSVFGQEGSKVAGLDAGADDYLTKPFGNQELLARIRVLLRRKLPDPAGAVVRFGEIEVDPARRKVIRAGRPVKLTAMEYGLLQFFLKHRDRALTHRQILRELWGPKAEERTHYLRIYVMRLRRKLEGESDEPGHFQTESGVGYRFVSEP